MFTTVIAAGALTLAGLLQTTGSGPDWDIRRVDDDALAFVIYDNGLSVGVRCTEDVLSVIVSGLPPAEGYRRYLSASVTGGGKLSAANREWFIGSSGVAAFHPFPGLTARQLRLGGALRIVVPQAAEGGANLVYAVDLPSSPEAIDEVLAVCDLPVTDPFDHEIDALGSEGLPEGFEWVTRPRPQYPQGPTFERGFVSMACISRPDGAIENCRVEAEHPVGGGFGEAALRSVRNARIRSREGGQPPGRSMVVTASFNFRMDYADPVDEVDRSERRDRRSRGSGRTRR